MIPISGILFVLLVALLMFPKVYQRAHAATFALGRAFVIGCHYAGKLHPVHRHLATETPKKTNAADEDKDAKIKELGNEPNAGVSPVLRKVPSRKASVKGSRKVSWKATPKEQTRQDKPSEVEEKRASLRRGSRKESNKGAELKQQKESKKSKESKHSKTKESKKKESKKNSTKSSLKKTEGTPPDRHERKRPTDFMRRLIGARQLWSCRSCAQFLDAAYEIDHIVPLFLGGTNEEDNLQALCRNCHGVKSLRERQKPSAQASAGQASAAQASAQRSAQASVQGSAQHSSQRANLSQFPNRRSAPQAAAPPQGQTGRRFFSRFW